MSKSMLEGPYTPQEDRPSGFLAFLGYLACTAIGVALLWLVAWILWMAYGESGLLHEW